MALPSILVTTIRSSSLLVRGPLTKRSTFSLSTVLTTSTGGSGVVYGLACLYSIIDAARQNRSIVRDVHFVWMIRSRGELHPVPSR
jgi:NAD(P)H-flavin reductase